MNNRATLFAVLALAAAPACAGDAKLGKRYFEGFGCVKCHTVDGKGGEYGPDLTFIGFRKSQEWLDLWLKNPHAWKSSTVMPNFHLTDAVRGDIVEFLGTLKGEGYKGAKAPWTHPRFKDDAVARGKAVFDAAGCAGCHGRGGVGGYPNTNVVGKKIPALLLVSDGYSKDELKTRIRDGAKPLKEDPSGPTPMIEMPKWGTVLAEDDIAALADYLFSLKPKSAASAKDEW